MVAAKDKSLKSTNLIATGLTPLPHVVGSCAIFGPNAGGKTTLIRAMQFMKNFVLGSFNTPTGDNVSIVAIPFLLDGRTPNQPTMLEVSILVNGIRHQYGFELTPKRIVSEWLLVYKTARPQQWFRRWIDPETEKDQFEFSSHFKGQKQAWQEQTRPNALFLSTAIQLNSEMLKPVHRWFSSGVHVFLDGGHLDGSYTTNTVAQNGGEHIVNLIKSADIAIQDIQIERKKGFQRNFQINVQSGELETSQIEAEILIPKFSHKSGEFKALFSLEQESTGTQKLYALAGPLLDILQKGSIMVIDELDRSLHPLLVRKIIEVFHNPALNKMGAQLMFSTHDATLLDGNLLRRDQVWLLQKDSSQSATLTPLTDFHPRNDEALLKGYLLGRYEGIPVLSQNLISKSSNGN